MTIDRKNKRNFLVFAWRNVSVAIFIYFIHSFVSYRPKTDRISQFLLKGFLILQFLCILFQVLLLSTKKMSVSAERTDSFITFTYFIHSFVSLGQKQTEFLSFCWSFAVSFTILMYSFPIVLLFSIQKLDEISCFLLNGRLVLKFWSILIVILLLFT